MEDCDKESWLLESFQVLLFYMQSVVVLSFILGFLVTVVVGKSSKGLQLCPKS